MVTAWSSLLQNRPIAGQSRAQNLVGGASVILRSKEKKKKEKECTATVSWEVRKIWEKYTSAGIHVSVGGGSSRHKNRHSCTICGEESDYLRNKKIQYWRKKIIVQIGDYILIFSIINGTLKFSYVITITEKSTCASNCWWISVAWHRDIKLYAKITWVLIDQMLVSF